jgi:peptidoglycan-associated lipoprotein
MKYFPEALKGRLSLASTLVAGLILTGCASQVPLDSSGTAGISGASGSAQSQATAKEIAAAKAAVNSVESSVYFDLDRFDIKPQYQGTITAFANYLKADTKAKILIEGHADERGTTEYNLALGQKRAESVGKALGLLGVAANRVEAISFGEEKPRAKGSNEEAWAKNRRADLIIR